MMISFMLRSRAEAPWGMELITSQQSIQQSQHTQQHNVAILIIKVSMNVSGFMITHVKGIEIFRISL